MPPWSPLRPSRQLLERGSDPSGSLVASAFIQRVDLSCYFSDRMADLVAIDPLVLLCHRLLRNAIFPKKINRLATCAQKY